MSDFPLRAGPPDPPAKPPPGGDTRQSPGADVKERIEKPRMFKVLIHNDDYTTMEFVVEVLMQVFHRSRVEATRIMLLIHNSGKGVAGVYTKEIAEAKADQATDRARSAGYPLLATIEPE